MKVIAYVDGSCFGNPGESGFGVVLLNDKGDTLATLGRYIGRGTNNIAEYQGVLGAIDLACSLNATSLQVYSDSELVVNQITGYYRIKQPHLIKLHQSVHDTLKKTGLALDIQHIPRNENKIADGLARKAIKMKADVT